MTIKIGSFFLALFGSSDQPTYAPTPSPTTANPVVMEAADPMVSAPTFSFFLTYPPAPPPAAPTPTPVAPTPTEEEPAAPGFFVTYPPVPLPTPAPTSLPTPVPTSIPTPVPTTGRDSKTNPNEPPSGYGFLQYQNRPVVAVPDVATVTIETPRPTRRPNHAVWEDFPAVQPTDKPSDQPTDEPTDKPTDEPTDKPTPQPTEKPTPQQTEKPKEILTNNPTNSPTTNPTKSPTSGPTAAPTRATTPYPTNQPTATGNTNTNVEADLRPKPTTLPQADASLYNIIKDDDTLTYFPGNLNQEMAGLKLSAGLGATILARSGQPVQYVNGQQSARLFHGRPDAGDTFPDTRGNNPGGWVYVSNSEMRLQDTNGTKYQGGVGAITFNSQGSIIDYKMVLENTTHNCGGGFTPWGSFVSCEEQIGGNIYQVDPFGERKGEMVTLGKEGGAWESFAFDTMNMSQPHFYITEDAPRGAVQRFTPNKVDWTNDPWKMLHGPGTTEYLKLIPNAQKTGGRFRWVKDRMVGRNNAQQFFPNTEGIEADVDQLYFVSKIFRQLYELNLSDMTYTNSSTVRGKFSGAPDQVARILNNNPNEKSVEYPDDLLYFTEEAGRNAGVHGRNPAGKYVTIFESPIYKGECTGLAFSPDARHLYVAYQDEGILLDVYRKDGNPFDGRVLNVKYHNENDANTGNGGGNGNNNGNGNGINANAGGNGNNNGNLNNANAGGNNNNGNGNTAAGNNNNGNGNENENGGNLNPDPGVAVGRNNAGGGQKMNKKNNMNIRQ